MSVEDAFQTVMIVWMFIFLVIACYRVEDAEDRILELRRRIAELERRERTP